ncbi:hypothetical protein [Streptomyces sp. WAC 04229]|nr:hypothetical protein [Streptomyces sp. WAC 04229]
MPTRRGSFAVNDDVEVPEENRGAGQFMVHALLVRALDERPGTPS